MKFIEDFKKFAFKGNVLDMAVGIIIGGAFGKIVSSVVNDIIMPIFGIILGGINFRDLKWVITPATGETPELALTYGMFIQSVVDFIIIAASIFIFIRIIGKLIRKKEKEEATPERDKGVVILEEIRDLLKDKK
ncbi:MAG: Large-conductance mechanosensitive channel [Firmicutes bacterium ADurb.Bin193]|nr:MAG: Large-conductance mechanosensitive channel [Firmicutes bacterium ADurb.Bin193]